MDSDVARDSTVRTQLLADGWRAATIRECALRNLSQVSAVIDHLATWLLARPVGIEIGESHLCLPQRICERGGQR